MSRLFYHVCQDNAGNLLFDVSGTMRIAGSGTLATIYGDEGLSVILPNPMTNHPSFGSFKCYLPSGSYDFYMAKAGYTFETLTGIQGLGTMALQDADEVAITGGYATSLAGVSVVDHPGDNQFGFFTNMMAAGGTGRTAIYAGGSALSRFDGPVHLNATVGIGVAPGTNKVALYYDRAVGSGIVIQPSADTGSFALYFLNAAATPVGSINTTGSATQYNTASDSRLKFDVAVLSGALDMLRQLRPITHLWKADGSRGVGFLAHEVQQVLPDAGIITGLPDAVDEDGKIQPQMIDYSKLVPFLVAALKELMARVEVLEQALA